MKAKKDRYAKNVEEAGIPYDVAVTLVEDGVLHSDFTAVPSDHPVGPFQTESVFYEVPGVTIAVGPCKTRKI